MLDCGLISGDAQTIGRLLLTFAHQHQIQHQRHRNPECSFNGSGVADGTPIGQPASYLGSGSGPWVRSCRLRRSFSGFLSLLGQPAFTCSLFFAPRLVSTRLVLPPPPQSINQ